MRKLLFWLVDRHCQLLVYQPKDSTVHPRIYLKMFGIMLYEVTVDIQAKDNKVGVNLQINKI